MKTAANIIFWIWRIVMLAALASGLAAVTALFGFMAGERGWIPCLISGAYLIFFGVVATIAVFIVCWAIDRRKSK